MELNPNALRALTHHPEVVEAVRVKAAELAEIANSLAVHVGRPDRPDPVYESGKSRVWPGNFMAVLDDAEHSTLLKAIAQAQTE
jgi:hypothetical protein